MTTLEERVAFLEGRVEEHARGVDGIREALTHLEVRMDGRFEAVDRRFEVVDRHFEAVDRHFEAVDKRFTALDEKVDRRFTALEATLARRFDAMDTKVGRQATNFMSAMIGLLVVAGGIIAALLRYR